MEDKVINLHPKNNTTINLKPNIVSNNIPTMSISMVKLSQHLQDKINLIDTNTVDITKNNADIAKNTEDIATNTADIIKNKAVIAKNTEDIAKNKADIAKNTEDINSLTSKDVDEKKNILIRFECREDGLYVVGTDI